MVVTNIPMQFAFSSTNMLFPLRYEINNSTLMNKPTGGFWTSTVLGTRKYDIDGNLYHIPYSDWMDWCIAERFKIGDKIFVIHPKDNLKVYDINTENDLLNVPIVNGISDNCIDYKLLWQEGYDGVHISQYIAMALHLHSFNKLMFNSWDSESTCWFNIHWIRDYKVIDFKHIKTYLNLNE